jgi:hypothetical protein
MREFKGNTIIVTINNGFENMPSPLTLQINKNANIPQRIKDNLKDKTFVNLLDSVDMVPVKDGSLKIQVHGKEAKIYKAS